MKLVVDTNILLSALMRDSLTRKILLDPRFEFYAPEHVFREIEAQRYAIIERCAFTEDDFYVILGIVMTNVTIIPKTDILSQIPNARKIMNNIDPDDVPFIALALSMDCDGVWTNDKHFLKQKAIKVWKTDKLIRKL